MSIRKNRFFYLGLSLLALIYSCDDPSIPSVSSLEVLPTPAPTKFMEHIQKATDEEFTDEKRKALNIKRSSWENKGVPESDFYKSNNENNLMNHISLANQIIEKHVLKNRDSIDIPADLRQAMINFMENLISIYVVTYANDLISNFFDVLQNSDSNIWKQRCNILGNLEFHIARQALILLYAVKYKKDLSEEERKEKTRIIINSFYEAYSIAFKKLSGIDISKVFRKMCNLEGSEYRCRIFKYDNATEKDIDLVLDLIIGAKIFLIESLYLVGVNPLTNQPTTLAEMCRLRGLVAPNDLGSINDFSNDPTLIEIALAACEFIHEVVNRFNELSVFGRINGPEIAVLQELANILWIEVMFLYFNMCEIVIIHHILRLIDGTVQTADGNLRMTLNGRLIGVPPSERLVIACLRDNNYISESVYNIPNNETYNTGNKILERIGVNQEKLLRIIKKLTESKDSKNKLTRDHAVKIPIHPFKIKA